MKRTPAYFAYGLALCLGVAMAVRYGYSPTAFGGLGGSRLYGSGLQHK